VLGIDGEPDDLRFAQASWVGDGELYEQLDRADSEHCVSCPGVRDELVGDGLRERCHIHDIPSDNSAFDDDLGGGLDHVYERGGRGKRYLGRRGDGDGARRVLGADGESDDLRFAQASWVGDGELYEQPDGADPGHDVSCPGVRDELVGDRLR